MPLDFPTSPTDGQIYEQYKWNATDSVWVLNNPSSDKTPVSAVVSGSSVTPTYDGTAAVYSFTADGNIIIESAGYADILLVGGGGSGGVVGAGGGGAGAHLYIENAYLPAGSLDVVVGAGGASIPKLGNDGRMGQNGLASSLWKYYAPGGGAGGTFSRSDSPVQQNPNGAISGGSGGGSGGYGHNGPPAVAVGISGLGNNGGIATNANFFAGAGGGGAGSQGSNTANGDGGAGGDGIDNSITGSAVTRAGGGGGARGTGSAGGAGGSGGGGAGGVTDSGTDGAANTGSGGGGAREGTGASSGAGGSGIVIVRIN